MNENNKNNKKLKWKLLKSSELLQYQENINEMYKKTYADIGMLMDSLKIIEYYPCSCYLLIDNTNNKKEMLSMIFYWASKFGNKISLVINDGSELSKAKMLEQICKLLNTDGFYGEFSDALEYIIRSKKNISNITDKTQILNILNGLELKNIDDKEFIKNDIFEEEDERRTTFLLNSKRSMKSPIGSYLRFLKDAKGIKTQHRKALYGIPCYKGTFNTNSCLVEKCE